MRQLNVIIIDDQEDSREKLVFLLTRYFPEVTIAGTGISGTHGIELINELKPEVVILDIELGDMSGFELLERLDFFDFSLIFCTAHNHYAIKAIRFHAIDYLVKPISKEDLQNALGRVADQAQKLTSGQLENLKRHRKLGMERFDKIALPTREGLLFKYFKEIIHLDADRNYTCFYLTDGSKILVSKTLKEFDEVLSSHGFFRVHHSHLINLKHIDKYIRGDGGYIIMSNGKAISIARNKKEDLLHLISG